MDPLIDRVFDIMSSARMIPEPRPELLGQNLTIEYVSLMAQAQKLVGIVGQDRMLQTVAGMTSVWPEARHKVKAFQVVSDYADQLGINPDAIRTDDEAEAPVAAEQDAMRRQMQAEEAERAAKSAQVLSQATLDKPSVLTRAMEGVQ